MSDLERVDYAHGTKALTGWLARPAGEPRGAVVVYPTIVNANAHMERRARMLADQGFLALIADFYGELPADFASAGALAEELRSDCDHFRARLSAAVATLRDLAPGLGLSAIGFCMGGQAVLELARAGEDLLLVASFHGVFGTARKASAATAHKPRVLLLHGDADPLAPRAEAIALWDELDAAGYDWHHHAYAGVRHGFTDPESDSRGLAAVAYDASADRQAWASLTALLDEIYG